MLGAAERATAATPLHGNRVFIVGNRMAADVGDDHQK